MATTAAHVPDEQTILPETTERATVTDLLAVLRQRGAEPPEPSARLISADGRHQVELPAELHDVLTRVVEALADGYAVTIAPQHTVLTTQQAADMLGVSRPTLTKLLDDGKIPYERLNVHRRIRLADVLRYQEQRRERRRQALDAIVQNSVGLGVYDE